MDAVFYAAKRTHLVGARGARRALKGFGLTPARFDLMNAVSANGVRQSRLWRELQVVRSVVSEMVRSLEEIGFLERRRDPEDRRTWRVSWTARGREVFLRAYARWIESGDVSVCVDAVLVNHFIEYDPEPGRIALITALEQLIHAFGWRGRGLPDLYLWDPEDYYGHFADTTLPPKYWGMPVAGQSSSDFESSAETS